VEKLVEYMKEQLQQLEQQKERAKEALVDIESTIAGIKQSTGYKIHVMLDKTKLNSVKNITPKHDGTHVVFFKNEISSDMLEHFQKFKLARLYSENGCMTAVFE